MAGTLQSVLAGRVLTGGIQAIKPGLPEVGLPPGLVNPPTAPVGNPATGGDYGVYRKVEGTRKTAKQAHRASPSRARTMSGVTEVPVKLISSSEHIEIKAETLMCLENDRGEIQKLGEDEVKRQVAECKQLQLNLRYASTASAFAIGHIYYDADGDLLHSSSNAVIDVDMAIPANNINQLNGIIDVSWANSAAGVVKQIGNLKKQSMIDTGYALKHALYGSNIVNAILNNSQLVDLINANPAYQTAFASGEVPAGFLGFTWWPAYNFFFEDDDGTNRTIFDAEEVCFIPDIGPEWFEVLEGGTPVPSTFGIESDLSAMMRSCTIARGMYAYAVGTVDPVAGKMVYGDCFLPVIKVPGAVYRATVIF
jgi:hypothetical protein